MKNLFLTTLVSLLLSFSLSAQVGPLIQNNWPTFTWPYNAYYPESSTGVNGHLGNACGYTSIARICHYWQFPVNGNGILDFDDFFGYHWYIDLENMNLNYGDMPYELDWNDPEPVYHETATLFLACGAIGEKIEIGFTDGIFRIPEAMQTYMDYSMEMEVLQRWDYSRDEWIAIFKNELDNGRPILIDGRTPSSPPPWEPGSWEGHFFVCDGYNENNQFYMNYMFGGISGYYDIDTMGTYSAFHRIITNFEPFNVGISENLGLDVTFHKLYPNPATDHFTVEITHQKILPVKIRLFNQHGMPLKEIANRTFYGTQQFRVNTSSLLPGIYLLQIATSGKTYWEKVIVIDFNATPGRFF